MIVHSDSSSLPGSFPSGQAVEAILPAQVLAQVLNLLTEGLLPQIMRHQDHPASEAGELRRQLDVKVTEVVALILRSDDLAGEALHAQRYLRSKLDYSAELIDGAKRRPAIDQPAEAVCVPLNCSNPDAIPEVTPDDSWSAYERFAMEDDCFQREAEQQH